MAKLESDAAATRPALRRRRRRGAFSPITRRILAINLAALVIVVAGLLYVDTYRGALIDAKITALATQGELIAAALGESVVTGADGVDGMDPAAARQLLARLAAAIETRTRLYDARGTLVADSRNLPGAGIAVQAATLPPPAGPVTEAAEAVYDWVLSLLPARDRLPPYVETTEPHASDYPELRPVIAGGQASALRDGGDMGAILNVAVPVQRFKEVQGALLLTTTIDDIEDSVRQVRYTILKLFGGALAVTVLLSLYLARTIAQPLHRLAMAADAVRHGGGHSNQPGSGDQPASVIPDFSDRGDEIGDLSQALGEMTSALDERLLAIERFAADVAHEIKNPLSSLRVAVETASRLDDPARQRELLAVARDDVVRLDRLITDISDASRLDAELARAETGPVDIAALLSTLAAVERSAGAANGPSIVLDIAPAEDGQLVVEGVEDRLAQVFRNIIANAKSFSQPGGVITITARRGRDGIEAVIEDQGPGIPAGKLTAIFERFYTERPAGEKFGTHSGLGLSISRQILETHGGVIFAENRSDDAAHPAGARFVVRLPA
ncbi:MAG: sensor histidine kinase [Alphaproteobacteria bacterium]